MDVSALEEAAKNLIIHTALAGGSELRLEMCFPESLGDWEVIARRIDGENQNNTADSP